MHDDGSYYECHGTISYDACVSVLDTMGRAVVGISRPGVPQRLLKEGFFAATTLIVLNGTLCNSKIALPRGRPERVEHGVRPACRNRWVGDTSASEIVPVLAFSLYLGLLTAYRVCPSNEMGGGQEGGFVDAKVDKPLTSATGTWSSNYY
jgi:hypothetical protein